MIITMIIRSFSRTLPVFNPTKFLHTEDLFCKSFTCVVTLEASLFMSYKNMDLIVLSDSTS